MLDTDSGVRLDRVIRTGVCGTWWSAATAGGHPLGLLQVDPALTGQAAARERLATAVAAMRSLGAPGVVRTSELVVEAGRAWLVVATAPVPTLADVLAGGEDLQLNAAAAIAVDTGEALQRLHEAGLGHGDLATDTIVLTPGGDAVLVEVGVLAALRGQPTDVGRDASAWASVVRGLAAAVPRGADELLSSAMIAAAGDLNTAVRRLARSRAGLDERESVIAAIPGARQAIGRVRPSEQLESAVDTAVPGGILDTPHETVPPPSRRPGRRRWRRAVIAVAVVVLLAAAASWWMFAPH